MTKEDYKYPLYAPYTAVEKGRYGRVLDEEEYDRMKDRRLERRGASNQSASGKPNTFGKKPAKYDGMSALEKVKASIRAKHGQGAIMDTKKK